MQRFILYVALVASLTLNVVGAVINLQFALFLTSSTFERLLLGAAVFLSDVLKASFPFLIRSAWSQRRYGSTMICIFLLPVTTFISATSTIGFASVIWASRAGSHQVQSMRYEALRSEFEQTREQLQWQPKHRPAKVVQIELSSMREHSRWRRSKKCTNATEVASDKFCRQYAHTQMELAVAQEAEALRRRLRKLSAVLETRSAGAINSQLGLLIDTLTQTINLSPDIAVSGPIILLVLFFEGFTIFGPFVTISALAHTSSRKTQHQPSSVKGRTLKAARKKASVGRQNERVRKSLRQAEYSATEGFLEQFTIRDSSGTVGSSELFEFYLDQHEKHEWPALSQRRFGDIMKTLGYTDKPKDTKTGHILYRGLRFVTPFP